MVVPRRAASLEKSDFIASTGLSNWARNIAQPVNFSVRTSVDSRSALAPGTMTIAFSPFADTLIKACPVGCRELILTIPVSTALSCKKARIVLPASSAPVAPIINVAAPIRAAATAWLAPLPPGKCARRRATTVSPGCGNLSTKATTSWLIEPSTQTLSLLLLRAPFNTFVNGSICLTVLMSET